MHPTRSLPLARRALALAAAPVLLLTAAACSDSDSGGDTASFCDRYKEFDERNDAIEDPTDEDFAAAVDAVSELDPPAEIEDDWNTIVEASRRLTEIDLSDPEALADVDFTEAEAASSRVETFLSEECGIDE